MDLDALLHNYFGTTDLDALDEATLEAGHQRVTMAFAVEQDSGRRFALWIILHALGDAPPPEKAFKNPAERKAAEDYARAASRLDDEE
jgi:hypothetical protein